MKKLLILAIFCMTAALVLPVLVSAADAPAAPAEPITMDKGGKGVVFQHKTHEKNKCVECHHPVDGKEDYRSCLTDGCHPVDPAEGKPASYKTLKGILHNKKPAEGYQTCLSCHTATAKAENMDKAATDKMTKCNDSYCHPKK